jgi:hypothetical protein
VPGTCKKCNYRDLFRIVLQEIRKKLNGSRRYGEMLLAFFNANRKDVIKESGNRK